MTRSPGSRAALTPVSFVAAALLAASPGSAQQGPARITLGDAARMAAGRNADAVVSREAAYQAGARSVQLRAALLPTLSSSTSVDGGDDPIFGSAAPPSSFPYRTRTLNSRLELTQRVFDLGALRRWQAGSADAAVAAATAMDAAEDAAESGALTYLSLLQATARVEARRADSSLAAELLTIARRQLEAGTAIGLDVTRGESRLAGAVSDLITARNLRDRAELELIRVVALPAESRIAPGDSLRPPAPSDLDVDEAAAVNEALARRADVVAAETSIEAARRQASALKAERLPAVSLYATTGSGPDGSMRHQTYGVRISGSIFDGFRREARIAESRSLEREAEARTADARLRVVVEVRSALLDLDAARQRVDAANVQLDLANQELAQARARFEAGIASNADLIDASLSLNRARDQVVDARTAYHTARVRLAAARGRTMELQ